MYKHNLNSGQARDFRVVHRQRYTNEDFEGGGKVSFHRYGNLQPINFIPFCSWLSAKKRRYIAAIWVSKRNPGGFKLANVCPKYSCLKLWRIKKTLFAMVVNSSGEPRLGSPVNEGHSFHSSLGATLNQNQSPSETKHRCLCWHPVVSSSANKIFACLGFATKTERFTKCITGENIKNEVSYCAKTSEGMGVKRVLQRKCEIQSCFYSKTIHVHLRADTWFCKVRKMH